MKRALLSVAGATTLGGCAEGSSTLSAYSIEASEIAHLSWVLFVGAAIVLVLVIVAILMALAGPGRVRRYLAQPHAVVIGGIAFPGVVLCACLVLNAVLLKSSHHAFSERLGSIQITVTGEQWWWRVAYPTRDGGSVATANEIRIPVGRDVSFTLKSADVIHAFWVPSLGGKVDMIPGRETRLRVHATRPGTFRGPCAEYCGGPHALMALQVMAMPLEDFDSWLDREAAGATSPAGAAELEGARLFLASGCGTCHAVRGTSAAGLVGPDLTHLASRGSIAAGTLSLSHDSLVRFITEGQAIKPGNAMPQFRFFSPPELDALVTYLLTLR